MRIAALAPLSLAAAPLSLAAAALLALAACEQQAPQAPPPEPAPPVGVAASDELAGLAAPATGIAFWMHPNVAFNSLMIVAGADGLASYNIEDGAEVSRAPGVNFEGAAVSYLGFGPQAAGVVAAFNPGDSAFAFYGIDNVSRSFLPLEATVDIRGAVRGFCFGRGDGVSAPTLFVVQRGKISIFNFDAADEGLAPAGSATIETPDDLAACAVDADGVLLAATQTGRLYRLDGDGGFASPFASTAVADTGGLAVISSDAPEGAKPAAYGQIAVMDKATGALHFLDRADGHALGAVTIAETDEIDGVPAAVAMGATGANLGGLYRNGLIALSVDGEAPSVRIIPINGVHNALTLTAGVPINPRGAIAPVEDDDLLIKINHKPG